MSCGNKIVSNCFKLFQNCFKIVSNCFKLIFSVYTAAHNGKPICKHVVNQDLCNYKNNTERNKASRLSESVSQCCFLKKITIKLLLNMVLYWGPCLRRT